MKKLLLIITATLALWAISTFIIGGQTKNQLENYIDKSNKIYINNGIQLKLVEYEKSFLNSKAKLEIDIIDPQTVKMLDKDYLLPLKIDYTIEHGPLFFQNGFGIGLSKIDNELLLSSIFKEDTKKEFLELVKGDINLKTEMVLAFSKKLHYNIKSDKDIIVNSDEKTFYMTPLSINGTTNIDTFKGNGVVKIEKLNFKEENSSNGIELTNLLVNMSVDEIFKDSLLFGDFKFSVDKIIIKDDTNPKFKKINISMDAEMANKRVSQTTMDSLFQGTINLANTQLEKEFKELESVHISMSMKELGIEGMSEFQKVAQNIQEKQSKLMSELKTQNSNEMQETVKKIRKLEENIVQEFIPVFNKLLIKDKTNISYELGINTKDKASSQASVQIGYQGDIEFKGSLEELTKKIKTKILSLININVDVTLNKKHLPIIPIPMLKQQLQMGVAQGFVKENNSSYSLNGYYKNRELMVNDNNLTSTVLPLLMMLAH